ncbi:MAG: DUF4401 domain-containing protein [Myxococcaceae bacterium]|nr:DUF4401 domain-containing protein [Myxococcaceae bacterium]MCI0670990.1 DUF4401 domain-containing protein [Myxococcaceae bacterium]
MSTPLGPTVREVLAELATEGAVPHEPTRLEAAHLALEAAAATDRESAPWFVRLLVALGSVIAVGFLLGFLFALELVRSAEGALVLGAILVGGALVVRRLGRGDLVGPGALTVSVAGELLVIGGAGGLVDTAHATVAAGTAVVLETALLVAYPDRVHRFLSTAAVAAGLSVLLHEHAKLWTLDILAVALAAGLHVLVHLRPRLEAGRFHSWVGPSILGLAASLFALLVVGLALEPRAGEALPPLGPLATVGLAAVALASSRAMAAEQPVDTSARKLWVLRGALVLLAALTLRAPGLLGALGVLGLAFHRRDALLFGLAVSFVLVFGTAFYYQLTLTLLAKSGVLIGSGAVLLLARAAVARLSRAATPAPAMEVNP